MALSPLTIRDNMPDLISRVNDIITSLNAGASNTALLANNSTYAFGKNEGQLNVNNAVTSGTANNATFAFGKSESQLNVNNATTAYGKTESNLNVNNAIYLNGGDSNFYRNATNLNSGTVADGRLSSNVPLKNAGNVFTADQEISKGSAIFLLRHQAGPARFAQWSNNTVWVTGNLFWNGTGWSIDDTGAGGHLVQISPVSGVGFYHATAGSNPRTIVETFRVDPNGLIYEKGRTAGLGYWTAFTPSLSADAGTWTFGDNDCKYCVVGNMCFVKLRIENSSLSSGSAAVLTVGNLPFSVNGGSMTDSWQLFHGGVWENNQFVQLLGGTASLSIQRGAGGFYTSGAGLYIRKFFFYEIST